MFDTLREAFKKIINKDWQGLKEDALNEAINYAEEHPDKVNLSAQDLKEYRREKNKEKQTLDADASTLEA